MSTLGCLPKCDTRTFTKAVETNEKFQIDLKGLPADLADKGSFVTFYYNNDEVKVTREEVMYDFVSFIGEAGGSLGLFLGISLISLFDFGGYVVGRLHELRRRIL